MVEKSPSGSSWRSNKPTERSSRSSKTFKKPPQPHMCIQDFLEGSHEPCYINVLSWEKIALPSTPEDYIPLFGGMQVPHSPPSNSPVFAVMAHPEVLRLKGKHAADPQETHALVLMLLDFVELMNRSRGLQFARHFQILPDRDLAGELKNVWAAVQMKRAADTAARAQMHQLASQEHQRQQQLIQHEEQIQHFRRQQQQLQKERQVLAQREQRYRLQQQQQDDLQRRMDEFEMEKYLEQRHHNRLLYEQQRSHKNYDHPPVKTQDALNATKSSEHTSSMIAQNVQEDPVALDFSVKRHTSTLEEIFFHDCKERRYSGPSQKDNELKDPDLLSTLNPTSPESTGHESSSLNYREQDYLSTSASESDCTSDDGDVTDVDSELVEGVGRDTKRHFLACVTVTVDSEDEKLIEKEAEGESDDGGASTLSH